MNAFVSLSVSMPDGLACAPAGSGFGSPAGSSSARSLLCAGHDLADWRTAGSGSFVFVDGRLESVPGHDVGLFWCTVPAPPDFALRLEWLRWRHEDASGVLVRFPEPRAAPDGNAAVTAARHGFAARIGEIGAPGETAMHRTGAIHGEPNQLLTPRSPRPAAEWNRFEIIARGQTYVVRLNGQQTTRFQNADPTRGLPTGAAGPSYIGLQIHPGSRVAFRNIGIEAL